MFYLCTTREVPTAAHCTLHTRRAEHVSAVRRLSGCTRRVTYTSRVLSYYLLPEHSTHAVLMHYGRPPCNARSQSLIHLGYAALASLSVCAPRLTSKRPPQATRRRSDPPASQFWAPSRRGLRPLRLSVPHHGLFRSVSLKVPSPAALAPQTSALTRSVLHTSAYDRTAPAS